MVHRQLFLVRLKSDADGFACLHLQLSSYGCFLIGGLVRGLNECHKPCHVWALAQKPLLSIANAIWGLFLQERQLPVAEPLLQVVKGDVFKPETLPPAVQGRYRCPCM